MTRGGRLRLIVFLSGLSMACRGHQERPVAVRAADVSIELGTRLHYRSIGTGRDTVLVIPGGPAFGGGYLVDALAPLASDATFLIIDLRGRGASDTLPDGPPGAVTLATDVDDVRLFRRALNIGPSPIIAHHYGALVATALARREPALVTRVLLIGPALARDLYQFDLVSESIDSALLRRAAAGSAGDPAPERCAREWSLYLRPNEETDLALVDELAPEICAVSEPVYADWGRLKQYVLIGPFDWRDTVATVSQPLLVIEGGLGRTSNADRLNRYWAQAWAAAAPDGRYLALEGSPIFPWKTSPAAFAGAVRTFLGGGWPAAAVRPVLPHNRPAVDSL
jgi:pimeloyl-ACP methyl ester carboxylesterase